MRFVMLVSIFAFNLVAQTNGPEVCGMLKDLEQNRGKLISVEGIYVGGLEMTFILLRDCDVAVYLQFSEELRQKSREREKIQAREAPNLWLLDKAFADTFLGIKGLKKSVIARVTGVLTCGRRNSREMECSKGKEALLKITSIDRVWMTVALE